jgi:hypothetical protein
MLNQENETNRPAMVLMQLPLWPQERGRADDVDCFGADTVESLQQLDSTITRF